MQAGIDLCQLPLERKKILAYLQKVAFCSWQVSLKIHGASRPSEMGKAEGSSSSVKNQSPRSSRPEPGAGRGAEEEPPLSSWLKGCASPLGCVLKGKKTLIFNSLHEMAAF